jgi:hypothetical protein
MDIDARVASDEVFCVWLCAESGVRGAHQMSSMMISKNIFSSRSVRRINVIDLSAPMKSHPAGLLCSPYENHCHLCGGCANPWRGCIASRKGYCGVMLEEGSFQTAGHLLVTGFISSMHDE